MLNWLWNKCIKKVEEDLNFNKKVVVKICRCCRVSTEYMYLNYDDIGTKPSRMTQEKADLKMAKLAIDGKLVSEGLCPLCMIGKQQWTIIDSWRVYPEDRPDTLINIALTGIKP